MGGKANTKRGGCNVEFNPGMKNPFESKTTRAVCGCLRQGKKRLILIDKEFEIRILFSVPFSTFDTQSAQRLRPASSAAAHCCEEGA